MMKRRNSPIGVFDTGIGGLTVLKQIRKRLLHENIVYLGDNSRMPYGKQSIETRLKWLKEAFLYLKNVHRVKCFVLACNTLSPLKDELSLDPRLSDLDLIDMIKPASVQIMNLNLQEPVLLATPTTIRSGLHKRYLEELGFAGNLHVIMCMELAETIERHGPSSVETLDKLKENLDKIPKIESLDIVLGCTHYPLLRDSILRMLGNTVTTKIHNPAVAVAAQVERTLFEQNLFHEETSASREIELLFTNSGTLGILKRDDVLKDIFEDEDFRFRESVVLTEVESI